MNIVYGIVWLLISVVALYIAFHEEAKFISFALLLFGLVAALICVTEFTTSFGCASRAAIAEAQAQAKIDLLDQKIKDTNAAQAIAVQVELDILSEYAKMRVTLTNYVNVTNYVWMVTLDGKTTGFMSSTPIGTGEVPDSEASVTNVGPALAYPDGGITNTTHKYVY